jgi:hypothetical protein
MTRFPSLLSFALAGCVEAIPSGSKGTPESTSPETDCEDWSEMCGCMDATEWDRTWDINGDDFGGYLDEDGELSDAQCFQICEDMPEEWEYYEEILDCAITGQDSSGGASITCAYYGAPYCEGRAHGAIESAGGIEAASRTHAWLARAAHAEASSVGAFLKLRRELAAHGAPEDLLRSCLLAARDESMHAGMMAGLCAREGVGIPPVVQSETQQRSLLDLAIENAVEGCVHEAFAAVQAAYQARSADSGEMRRLFACIARDESRHAQLAQQIHHWLKLRLDARENHLVEQARLGALGALCGGVASSDTPFGDRSLGLPGRDMALAIAGRFAAEA